MGSDPGEDETNVVVLRSTDSNLHGMFDMSGGAMRLIPTTKVAKLEINSFDIFLREIWR